MIPRPVADSVDALVAGASSRTPVRFDDSKSGARFERVVIDGERLPAEARRPPRRLDHAPDRRHRVHPDPGVGVGGVRPAARRRSTTPPSAPRARARTARCCCATWASGWCPPGDDAGRRSSSTCSSSTTSPRCTPRRGGGTTTVGLLPDGEPLLVLRTRRARVRGRARVPVARPPHRHRGLAAPRRRVARARRRAPTAARRAVAVVRRARRDADRVPPRRHEVRQPRRSDPTAGPILIDWSQTGEGPPLAEIAHQLALNRARIPVELARDATVDAYRAALERHGVDTAPWFERQLALCLVGRDAPARLGEGVRRDRRTSSPGGATASSTPRRTHRASEPASNVAEHRPGPSHVWCSCAELLEEVGLFAGDLLVERLEAREPGDVRADLRAA